MNTTFATGWLQKAGCMAYTRTGRPKLAFDLMMPADEAGDPPTPWHCEIEDRDLIAHAEPLLTPGRSVIVSARMCGRPYKKHDIITGFTRYLRVTAIEFAKVDRANPVPVAEEEERANA